VGRRLLRFLRKNSLAVILAAVPPIAIWFYLQREYSALEVVLISDVPVVSVNDQYSDGLIIQYRGSPLSSLSVLDLRIRNNGTLPIRASDFEEPLALTFRGHLLASPQINSAQPEMLRPEIALDPPTVKLKPLLLNPGDWFILRVLLADRSIGGAPFSVMGRIVGVRLIETGIQIATPPIGNRLRGGIIFFMIFISLAAASWLMRKIFSLVRTYAALRDARRAASQLPTPPEGGHSTESLARELGIRQHDVKTNLFLLRLKIESLLREIAESAHFPDGVRRDSVHALTDHLLNNRIIDRQIAVALRDIMPILNSEVHSISTDLNDVDVLGLQELGLRVATALTDARRRLDQASNKE
jgi:hypothetical protein